MWVQAARKSGVFVDRREFEKWLPHWQRNSWQEPLSHGGAGCGVVAPIYPHHHVPRFVVDFIWDERRSAICTLDSLRLSF